MASATWLRSITLVLACVSSPARASCGDEAFPVQQCNVCVAGKFSPQPCVSTVAAGGSTLSTSWPNGIAISHDNASLLVTTATSITTIDIITQQSWDMSASLLGPAGIAMVPGSYKVLVVESSAPRISFMDTATNQFRTLAGSTGNFGAEDGIGTSATFWRPTDIAVSANGSHALVADCRNHNIRVINLVTLSVSTLAGSNVARLSRTTTSSDATGCGVDMVMSVDECQILAVGYSWQGSHGASYRPQGCYIQSNSYVYYNTYQSTTRCSNSYPCICFKDGGYQDGYGTAAQFKGPRGITISSDGTKVFVADSQSEHIDIHHDTCK